MNSNEILSGQSFLPHKKPKKLIFMLHGYGDSAENFINIANLLDNESFKANYFALNAPSTTPNYPSGKQWFDLNPNGIYIADAGLEEFKIIKLPYFEKEYTTNEIIDYIIAGVLFRKYNKLKR